MGSFNTLFILLMWVGVFFPVIYFFRIRRWKKPFIIYLIFRIILSVAVLKVSIELGSLQLTANQTELEYYLQSIQHAEMMTIFYTVLILVTIFYDFYLISKTKTFLYPVK